MKKAVKILIGIIFFSFIFTVLSSSNVYGAGTFSENLESESYTPIDTINSGWYDGVETFWYDTVGTEPIEWYCTHPYGSTNIVASKNSHTNVLYLTTGSSASNTATKYFSESELHFSELYSNKINQSLRKS